MNYFFFVVKSALGDLMRNKIKTFLTALGIIIGVASVVILIAFGLGLRQFIQDQFDNLGTNLVYVFPGQIFSQSGGFRATAGTTVNFDEKDLFSLKKIRLARTVIPVVQKSVKIEGQGKTEMSALYGTSQELFPARNFEIEYGKIFDKTDVDKRNKIAVMGPEIAKKIFGQTDLALDQKVRIEEQTFKVVGVLKSKGGGGFGGPNFDNFVYIPYKTAFILTGKKIFNNFVIKVGETQDIDKVKRETKGVLLKRYDEGDFTVADSKEVVNTIGSIFTVLNSILVAIGAVSLVVGGIGIMNIMYVSVTERIKEIGIRRSIGAMEKDILYQFLAESVLLSLIGGFFGIILAVLVVLVIRFFFPAYVDVISIFWAVGVSFFIGIFFGVFPARKAAKLSPIDAIRYE